MTDVGNSASDNFSEMLWQWINCSCFFFKSDIVGIFKSMLSRYGLRSSGGKEHIRHLLDRKSTKESENLQGNK